MPTQQIGVNDEDGAVFGSSATKKIGFYGVTPIVQRSAALQSGSGVSAASASYGATQAAWAVEVTATLIALGFWKGAA